MAKGIPVSHHPHVVFYAGGAVYGAFTGGLREAAALAGEKFPDVYVVNSAGFTNALPSVVAKHRINRIEAKEQRIVSDAEAAQIIYECHDHLWDSIERDFTTFMPPDGSISESMLEQLHKGSKHLLPVAKMHAGIAAIGGAWAMQLRRYDMFDTLRPFELMQNGVRESHFWAQYLRKVFPDVDTALHDENTPRILAHAHNFATNQDVWLDSNPPTRSGADTLGRLVATMSIVGQVPLVDNILGDGGYTGFNGDDFSILQRLMDEDAAYANAKITFVDLGQADMAAPEVLQRVNPNYLANRAAAVALGAEVKEHFHYREFKLDRTRWKGGKDKFLAKKGTVSKLRQEGREAFAAGSEYNKPTCCTHQAHVRTCLSRARGHRPKAA